MSFAARILFSAFSHILNTPGMGQDLPDATIEALNIIRAAQKDVQ